MIFFGKNKKKDALTPRRRQISDDEPRVRITDGGNQFRRGQTLSTHRYQDEQPSERARVHDLTRRRRRMLMVLGLVIGIVALLTIILTQFTAKVIVSGSAEPTNRVVEPSDYEKAINEYYAIHPVERLRFFLNEQALSEYVGAMTPEVEAVEFSRAENIVEAHYSLDFREPIAGWQINGRQYFVDQHGVVFGQNYYQAPSLQIVDQSGISPEQGSTVASTRLLSFVGRVAAISKEQGSYEVVEAQLPVGTTRQIEIRLKDIQPTVKLTIDRAAGEQVEDMTRALQFLKDNGQGAQYIDVRVAGRAVYL